MTTLPQVRLGDHTISRLLIGGNPFSGNSHYSAEWDNDMLDYFTIENIKAALFECERQGLTAMQSRGDRHILRMLREYRNEGGKLHWIAQIASELSDLKGNIRQIAAAGAIAAYHHGTRSDNLWHAGRIDEARELLQTMRDCGLAVGMGSHIPEVIEYVEAAGWDLDFYLCSVYNLSKQHRESQIVAGKRAEEHFDDADREKMFKVIQSVSKPCLVIKIMGAGRNCTTPEQTRETFRYTFARIKPTDAVIVGMFPKYRNQIEENARFVREACAELEGRALAQV
ncbi:MAG TPA: hypothetical protein VFB21_18230 [Chthonomonadaceae bacterium]|nr:hypothetical protein [Chthonomonadaceae bacterium]